MLQSSPTSAAEDLQANLNEVVSLGVGARLMGIVEPEIYRLVNAGLLKLAPRNLHNRRRVTLRELETWGADIRPEAVANAERAFAAEVLKRKAKAKAKRIAAVKPFNPTSPRLKLSGKALPQQAPTPPSLDTVAEHAQGSRPWPRDEHPMD